MRRKIAFTKGIVNDGVELSVALGHELSRAPDISDIQARGISLLFTQARTDALASQAQAFELVNGSFAGASGFHWRSDNSCRSPKRRGGWGRASSTAPSGMEIEARSLQLLVASEDARPQFRRVCRVFETHHNCGAGASRRLDAPYKYYCEGAWRVSEDLFCSSEVLREWSEVVWDVSEHHLDMSEAHLGASEAHGDVSEGHWCVREPNWDVSEDASLARQTGLAVGQAGSLVAQAGSLVSQTGSLA